MSENGLLVDLNLDLDLDNGAESVTKSNVTLRPTVVVVVVLHL